MLLLSFPSTSPRSSTRIERPSEAAGDHYARPSQPTTWGHNAWESPTEADGAFEQPHGSDMIEEGLDQYGGGHAVDVLQLWDRSWLGAGRRVQPQSQGPLGAGSMGRICPCQTPSPSGPDQKPPANAAPQLEAAAHSSASPATPQQAVPQAPSTQPTGSRALPTPPLCTLPPGLPAEALAEPQQPVIGTWSGRRRVFATPDGLQARALQDSHASLAQQGQYASSAGYTERPGCPILAAPGQGGCSPRIPTESEALHGEGSCGEADLATEAWRWQFSRRWQAARDKCHAHTPRSGKGRAVADDELDAIQYAQACGIGANLQFTPHLHYDSTRGSQELGGLRTSTSCQFDVSAHGSLQAPSCLRAAESLQDLLEMHASRGEQSEQPSGEAWQASSASDLVLSMATKAKALLQKQRQIEEEAQSRWEQSLGGGYEETWAGQHLRPVHISMSGRFPYLVLRALDGRGRQRYLVRGRGGTSSSQLAEETAQEATAVCRRECLPQLALEEVGGGVMEWREDTDRHLHISSAPTSRESISGAGGSGLPPGRGSYLAGDAAGLAASLVRQALPCHFHITSSSSSSSASSFAGHRRLGAGARRV